ncbi:MAG TPA: E3 binding domain-containing protein, partial [Trueperaceae bacterium]
MSEPNISPLAKRLAEENNVDWRRLLGSGPDGRVVERDVLEYLARVMSGEESIDPTPEPLPSGMDAWPEDDIRGFHPQPQSARPGPQHKDELDLSGFDDEVALEPAFDTRPDERHGKGAAATGGDFYSTQTSLPAYEDPSAALEDDEDLLEIDDEPGSQDAAEAEAPAAAGSFGSDAEEDEPVIGADLFLFDEESDDEEDLPLFDVDEPAGDDADAPIFSADASDPWETDPTSEPGSSDSGTPAALPQDDPWPTGSDDEPVFGAQVDAAGQTRDDDIVPAEDGFGADDSEEEEEDELDLSAFDLELESGHEAAPEELDDSQPEPAAEFTDETTGFAGDESFSDPADFDPFAPDEPENLAPL